MKDRKWILWIHKSDDWRKQLSPLEFREQMEEDDIIKMQMLRREPGLRALWKEPCLAGPGTSEAQQRVYVELGPRVALSDIAEKVPRDCF